MVEQGWTYVTDTDSAHRLGSRFHRESKQAAGDLKILDVPTKSLRIIYSGRVQGVGFRYTTCHISGRYDVSGYVKNLPDGTVEVVVTGPAGEVSDFIAEIAEAMRRYIAESCSEPYVSGETFRGFRVRY